MRSDARAVWCELFRCFQLARTRSEIPIRKEDAPEEMMRLRILRIGAGRLPRQVSGFGDFSSLQIDRGERDQRRNMVRRGIQDRKSTRLNSSHRCISYAVFCL